MACLSLTTDLLGWLAPFIKSSIPRDITQVIGAFRVVRVIRSISDPFAVMVVVRGKLCATIFIRIPSLSQDSF